MLLQKLTVLVCEDEPLIALDLQFELAEAGATTLIATTVADGLGIVRSQRVDLAVLDMNLGGKDSAPIAAELEARKIPYLVYSGFVTGADDQRSIAKPAASSELVSRLAKLKGRQS